MTMGKNDLGITTDCVAAIPGEVKMVGTDGPHTPSGPDATAFIQ